MFCYSIEKFGARIASHVTTDRSPVQQRIV